MSRTEFGPDTHPDLEQLLSRASGLLDAGVASAVDAHVRQNPQGRHGRHEYSLEQYGLSPERVRERFARYIESYRLPAD